MPTKLTCKKVVVVIDSEKSELVVFARGNVSKVDLNLVSEGSELVLFHKNIIIYFYESLNKKCRN